MPVADRRSEGVGRQAELIYNTGLVGFGAWDFWRAPGFRVFGIWDVRRLQGIWDFGNLGFGRRRDFGILGTWGLAGAAS